MIARSDSKIRRGKIPLSSVDSIEAQVDALLYENQLIQYQESLDPGNDRSVYLRFVDQLVKSRMNPEDLDPAILFFNEHLAPRLKSKEAWIQVLAMELVYMDIFTDVSPKGLSQWELSNHVQTSLITGADASQELARSYVLAADEWGRGGREHLGLKAQLWVPKDPQSKAKNVMVFRGTALSTTYQSLQKKLGKGLKMNLDRSGIGKSSFDLFKPVFKEWVYNTKSSGRGLIITGHSLGGSLALRLLDLITKMDPEWVDSHVESILFNSPGVDHATALELDHHSKILHILNGGDFFPHIHVQPHHENLMIHHFLKKNQLSFPEAIEVHNYPAITALESRGIDVKLLTDNARSPVALKKIPMAKSHFERKRLPFLTKSQLRATLEAQTSCHAKSIHGLHKKRDLGMCPTIQDWALYLDKDGIPIRLYTSPKFLSLKSALPSNAFSNLPKEIRTALMSESHQVEQIFKAIKL